MNQYSFNTLYFGYKKLNELTMKKYSELYEKCKEFLPETILEDYKINDTIQERSSNIYPYIRSLKRIQTNDRDNFLKYYNEYTHDGYLTKKLKSLNTSNVLVKDKNGNDSIPYKYGSVEFFGSRDLFVTNKVEKVLKDFPDKDIYFNIFSFGLEKSKRKYPFFNYEPYIPPVEKISDYILDTLKKPNVIKYKKFKEKTYHEFEDGSYIIALNLPYDYYKHMPYIDKLVSYNMDDDLITCERFRTAVLFYKKGFLKNIYDGISIPIIMHQSNGGIPDLTRYYYHIFFALYFKLPTIPVILYDNPKIERYKLPWINGMNHLSERSKGIMRELLDPYIKI